MERETSLSANHIAEQVLQEQEYLRRMCGAVVLGCCVFLTPVGRERDVLCRIYDVISCCTVKVRNRKTFFRVRVTLLLVFSFLREA
jgi:hypothetical protein